MALNIKDPQTEQLAREVAALTRETKTAAIRTALLERKQRLTAAAPRQTRADTLRRFLTHEAWPQIPHALLGQAMSRHEKEEILGYGPEGI